jgi:hypothetical protein
MLDWIKNIVVFLLAVAVVVAYLLTLSAMEVFAIVVVE